MNGFSLITVIVISSISALLGVAGLIMSKTGYDIISAEEKHYLASENAESGINLAVNELVNGKKCEEINNTTFGNAKVYTIKAGDSCFIFSKGYFQQAEVVKTTILSSGKANSKYGALVLKKVENLILKGSGAVVSCDEDCKVPALVTESDIDKDKYVTGSCEDKNKKGFVAEEESIADNTSLGDLAETYFYLEDSYGSTGREKLLNKLSEEFGIEFDNGTPVGLTGNMEQITDLNGKLLTDKTGTFEICKASFNTCEAYEEQEDIYVILCENDIKFVWDKQLVVYRVEGTSIYCESLDLGENSTLKVSKLEAETEDEYSYKDFPRIAVQNVEFEYIPGYKKDDEKEVEIENVILVVRESMNAKVPGEANELEIEHSFIFGKNISFNIASNYKFEAEEALIYSGGVGQGNLNLDIQGEAEFGEEEEPVIFIVDNNVNVNLTGNAEVYAVLYVTSDSNNVNIDVRGNIDWYGTIVSNTPNNNINIRGNATIEFNKKVIDNINTFLPFFNKAECEYGNTDNINLNLINTKLTVY